MGLLNDFIKLVKEGSKTISEEAAKLNAGQHSAANTQSTQTAEAQPTGPVPADATGPKGGSITKRIAPKQEMFCFYDKDGRLVFYHLSDLDDSDRIIRKAAYNPNGSKIVEREYKYDERGNEILGSWDFYSRPYLYRLENKYDENSRCIESWAHGDTLQRVVGNRVFNTFNHDDNIVDSSYICKADEATGQNYDACIYRYNWNEARTERINTLVFRENETEPFSGTFYEYNYTEDGKIIKKRSETPIGTVEFTDVERYDKDGHLIDTTRFDKDGKFESVCGAER